MHWALPSLRRTGEGGNRILGGCRLGGTDVPAPHATHSVIVSPQPYLPSSWRSGNRRRFCCAVTVAQGDQDSTEDNGPTSRTWRTQGAFRGWPDDFPLPHHRKARLGRHGRRLSGGGSAPAPEGRRESAGAEARDRSGTRAAVRPEARAV